MFVSDMKCKLDKAQFGNQKYLSIQHYLIRMINRILSVTDNNINGEARAVLCLFVDMKQAYLRQDHTLGVNSFIDNGVRPELIPLLISYFEDRTMQVKWHRDLSEPRKLPGSGAIGSNFGNWELLSETNSYMDFVKR